MDLKNEKAWLLKRLAIIEGIEKETSQIEKTAKRLGFKNARALLAAVASQPDKSKAVTKPPAKTVPVKRRPNLTAAEKVKIKAAYKGREEGETAASIAKRFQIAEPTLFKVLNPPKKSK